MNKTQQEIFKCFSDNKSKIKVGTKEHEHLYNLLVREMVEELGNK